LFAIASLLSVAMACSGQARIDFPLTYIGNPGNPAEDPPGDFEGGDVGYAYYIGTYELTVAHYTEFLNTVAKSDPYQLWAGGMGDGGFYGVPTITRTGEESNYVYSIVPGTENEPVRFVSYYDACRFCNWLANGQGTGSTETGSYDVARGLFITRNTNATWVLPSEDEWYKAAYYDLVAQVYYEYPNGSDAEPPEPTDGTTPREMNFGDEPAWHTTEYFMAIGETTGRSPYSVHDMGGNIREWTESYANFKQGPWRVIRGGSAFSHASSLSSATREGDLPGVENDFTGFRATYVIAPADIAVQKTGAPDVLRGHGIDYAISITNNGPGEAATVRTVDNLPSDVSLEATSSDDCALTNGAVVCDFGMMAVHAATSFTITVRANGRPGIKTNIATVSSVSDPNVVDNTSSVTTRVIKTPVPLDFDGDGASDVAVVSRGSFNWSILGSAGAFISQQFGYVGAVPVPGDYDGDGITDFGVFNPRRARWYLLQSSNGFVEARFGDRGDVPLPADYDGDARTDMAVFDPPSGMWTILQSSAGLKTQQFGFRRVIPVPADYDGDGQDDIAVFDPRKADWYLLRSNAGFHVMRFGDRGMTPLPADYDGDGAANPAVYDPPSGTWHILLPDGQVRMQQFGFRRVLPVPADYDGDGIADLAVYDPLNGDWYLQQSENGFKTFNFGFFGTVPVGDVRRP
jgi:uncharacterized repeat protein (TIGR01451 family)